MMFSKNAKMQQLEQQDMLLDLDTSISILQYVIISANFAPFY